MTTVTLQNGKLMMCELHVKTAKMFRPSASSVVTSSGFTVN